MKRSLIILMIAAALCGCTENQPSTVGQLKVSPPQIDFEAENAQPREITVTAENVEWEYTLTDDAKEWITVGREESILTVTATDNTSPDPRNAVLTVRAKNSESVKAVEIPITQKGADISYSISLNPESLSFAAEDAPAQAVTVTTEGEGLTWSTELEESAKSWITIEEGDGRFTVKVTDNPETEERVAIITVVPSQESAQPKAVHVMQKGKVLEPSLTMTLTDGVSLEEGFVFNYTGTRSGWKKAVVITAVNLTWDAKIQYDTPTAEWVELHTYQSEDQNHIEVMVNKNTSPDPRTCNIIVTTDAPGVGPFTVKITQQGMPEFLSTLTEDRDLGKLTHGTAIMRPNSDTYNRTYTTWDIRFWNDGLEFDGRKYTGSGDKLCVFLASDPISENPENIYYLPDGVYSVVANFNYAEDATPGTVSAGLESYSPDFPLGTWYQRIENDSYAEDACITEGTLTVSRTGDKYEITFELVSDAAYDVTGAYEGTLDVKIQ